MNVIAFLFAIIGAALNMFQPVIRTPASGSNFTGSMYDAVRTIMTSGLPSEGGTVLAILILAVLCLIPVVAAVTGLFIPSSERDRTVIIRIGIILFLCALADGLATWGIYHLSSESFMSTFLTNYVVPYAQKVSFIAPAIWAVCYLIAGVLVLMQPCRRSIIPLKLIYGPSIVFGLGWTKQKNSVCDLDASAFLFGANGRYLGALFYGIPEEKPNGALVYAPYLWSTGDNKKGNSKPDAGDLEQIMVLLNDVPPDVHQIIFTVTVNNGTFEHPLSAHARLVERVVLSEHHIEDKTLRIGNTVGQEAINSFSLKEDAWKKMDGLIVAEIHRKPDEGWVFSKIMESTSGGFEAVCRALDVPTSGR